MNTVSNSCPWADSIVLISIRLLSQSMSLFSSAT